MFFCKSGLHFLTFQFQFVDDSSIRKFPSVANHTVEMSMIELLINESNLIKFLRVH